MTLKKYVVLENFQIEHEYYINGYYDHETVNFKRGDIIFLNQYFNQEDLNLLIEEDKIKETNNATNPKRTTRTKSHSVYGVVYGKYL